MPGTVLPAVGPRVNTPAALTGAEFEATLGTVKAIPLAFGLCLLSSSASADCDDPTSSEFYSERCRPKGKPPVEEKEEEPVGDTETETSDPGRASHRSPTDEPASPITAAPPPAKPVPRPEPRGRPERDVADPDLGGGARGGSPEKAPEPAVAPPPTPREEPRRPLSSDAERRLKSRLDRVAAGLRPLPVDDGKLADALPESGAARPAARRPSFEAASVLSSLGAPRGPHRADDRVLGMAAALAYSQHRAYFEREGIRAVPGRGFVDASGRFVEPAALDALLGRIAAEAPLAANKDPDFFDPTRGGISQQRFRELIASYRAGAHPEHFRDIRFDGRDFRWSRNSLDSRHPAVALAKAVFAVNQFVAPSILEGIHRWIGGDPPERVWSRADSEPAPEKSRGWRGAGVGTAALFALERFGIAQEFVQDKLWQDQVIAGLDKSAIRELLRDARKDRQGRLRSGIWVRFKDGSERFESRDGYTEVRRESPESPGKILTAIEDRQAGFQSLSEGGRTIFEWRLDPKSGEIDGEFYGAAFRLPIGVESVLEAGGERVLFLDHRGEGPPRPWGWLARNGDGSRSLEGDKGDLVSRHLEGGASVDSPAGLVTEAVLSPRWLMEAVRLGKVDFAGIPEEVATSIQLDSLANLLPVYAARFEGLGRALRGGGKAEEPDRGDWIEEAVLREGRLHLRLRTGVLLEDGKPTEDGEGESTKLVIEPYGPSAAHVTVYQGSTVTRHRFLRDFRELQIEVLDEQALAAGEYRFRRARSEKFKDGAWIRQGKDDPRRPLDLEPSRLSLAMAGLGHAIEVMMPPQLRLAMDGSQSAAYGAMGTIWLAAGNKYAPLAADLAVPGSGALLRLISLGGDEFGRSYATVSGYYTWRQSKLAEAAGAGASSADPESGQRLALDAYRGAVGLLDERQRKQLDDLLDAQVSDRRRQALGPLWEQLKGEAVSPERRELDRAMAAAHMFGLGNLARVYFEKAWEEAGKSHKAAAFGWGVAAGAVAYAEGYLSGAVFGMAAEPLKLAAAGELAGIGRAGAAQAMHKASRGLALSAAEAKALRLIQQSDKASKLLFTLPDVAAVGGAAAAARDASARGDEAGVRDAYQQFMNTATGWAGEIRGLGEAAAGRLIPRRARPGKAPKLSRPARGDGRELSGPPRHHGADPEGHLKRLRENGLYPTEPVMVGDAVLKVGRLFDMGGGRVGAFVLAPGADGSPHLRLFYRSNSQGGFRVLPARNKGLSHAGIPGYDKGPGESSLAAPSALETHFAAELLKGPARTVSDPSDLVDGAVPVNRSIEEYFRYEQDPGHVGKRVRAAPLLETGGVDPAAIRIADPAKRPDFSVAIRQYRTVAELAGEVDALVYRSRDGSVEYTVLKDQSGRIWFSNVEFVGAALNEFGIPSQTVDAGALLKPRWEYEKQIPAQYRGAVNPRRPDYFDAWDYLRRIPEVQEWYRVQGLEPPGAAVGPSRRSAALPTRVAKPFPDPDPREFGLRRASEIEPGLCLVQPAYGHSRRDKAFTGPMGEAIAAASARLGEKVDTRSLRAIMDQEIAPRRRAIEEARKAENEAWEAYGAKLPEQLDEYEAFLKMAGASVPAELRALGAKRGFGEGVTKDFIYRDGTGKKARHNAFFEPADRILRERGKQGLLAPLGSVTVDGREHKLSILFRDQANNRIIVQHPRYADMAPIRRRAFEILAEAFNDPGIGQAAFMDRLAESYRLLMHATPYDQGSPAIVESLYDAMLRAKFGSALPPKSGEPFWDAIFWPPDRPYTGSDFLNNFRSPAQDEKP